MEDFDIHATLGMKAAEPADASQKLRGSRFDRADFAARRPALVQETAKQPLLSARPAIQFASAEPAATQTATGPLTAASPSGHATDEAQVTADHLRELGWPQAKIQKILDGPEPADEPSDSGDPTAQAEAHLLSLGWSKSDIARLLVGPEQSHLTAEALFRQHAANSADDQAALLKALTRAGAQRVKPDPSLLSGLNVSHLSPEDPIDLEQLISQFAALPDVQKQRFLLLLSSQKLNKKSSTPRPDGTSAPPTTTSGGSPKSSGSGGDVLPVVKSSLDLLSTALKGLLGTAKEGSQKGSGGSTKGTPPKTSAEDEPDSDESSSRADEDTPDEDRDDSMDDVPSTDDDRSSPSEPEDLIGAGSESEPD